jgi:TPR repeat protein
MRTVGWLAAVMLAVACNGGKTGIEKDPPKSKAGISMPGKGKAEPGMMLQSACEEGDADKPETAESCFQLGKMRMSAARPDIVGARAAYSHACNAHHGAACYELGKMVRDARGGPKDARRALDVLGIACEQSVAAACVDLGVLLYDGSSTTKVDAARAVALFQPACQADPPSALACSRLARANAEGLGVPEKDEEQARALYTKACDTNDPQACVDYGMWLGAMKKKEDAISGATFLEKACTADAHFGCYELAGLHAAEKSILPEASAEKAAFYYQRACNIDPTHGCFEAAELMELGKVPARKEQIQSLYNVACEHGNSEACSRRSPD